MRIKLFLLSAVAMLTMTNVSAQDSDKRFFNHLSVGVTVGTPGFGLDVAMPICHYVDVRAGFTVFPKIKYDTELDLNVDEYRTAIQPYYPGNIPSEVSIEAKTGFTNGKILFDVYPSKKSIFHLTVGAYFGTSEIVSAFNTDGNDVLKAIHQYNQNATGDKIGLELGEKLLEPDENGNVKAQIKTASFKPYLGIGIGRAVPRKKRLGFMFELGCQFWGTPKIYCNGDEITENDVDGEDGGAIKTLSKITVYPVMNFRLCGRIL